VRSLHYQLIGRRLRREVSKSEWHVFHETNYVAPDVSVPLVTSVHDMCYLRHPEFSPGDRVKWLRAGLERTFRRAAAIIVDSEFTRRELLELCPSVTPDKVHVILLGVHYERFADPANVDRSAMLRAQWNLPKRFALFLGTLEPRKNLQGLISAYERLPTDLQHEFPLVLAGTPGWRQEYFRPQLDALRRRGLLFEIGYVAQEDVPALLAAADVFCFPSLYEGFGLPPLEAAAAGTPVLCGDAASLPEVMGDAAVYVDPHDVDGIAAGLQSILKDADLRDKLRAAGRRRARQFTWERCARQTLDVYRRVA
jgi:alpha-1,3-rhamnosyl/mannosyltransferase